MSEPEAPRGLAAIILAIRQYWIAAVIAGLVVLLPGAFLVFTQKPDYKSVSVVGLVPTRTQSDTFLRAVAQQLPTYLTSPEVTNRVGATVGLTGAEVDKAISVEIPPATLNVTTTALAADSETASRLANEIANEAMRDKEYREFFTPTLLSPAVPASKPSGVGRAVLLAVVLVVAFIVAVIAALVGRDLGEAKRARSGGAAPGSPS